MRSAFLLLLFFSAQVSFAEIKNCTDALTVANEGPVKDWIDDLNALWSNQKGEFKRSQLKKYSEALTHLSEDLREVGESSSLKDKRIKELMTSIAGKLPLIKQAYENLKVKDRKTDYFKSAYQAMWATLTVHAHEVLEMRSKDKDFPRFFKILKTIDEFNPKQPEFSFYKIKRAIEGRFSLKEYINCHL